MKHQLGTLALTFLIVIVAVPLHADSAAQRTVRQKERIAQGVASGSLTTHEATQLERQQNHIENLEKEAAADGKVSGKEKVRIHAAEDRASANIAAKKHNHRHK